MSNINIIVGVAQNSVIGKENKIPWHYKEDMKFFKNQTTGNIVIMGRKTYESIGRALPNRETFVLSRNADLTLPDATVFTSLQDAVLHAKLNFPTKVIYIAGGSEIYNEALRFGFVDTITITRIPESPEGDAFFVTDAELENAGFEKVDNSHVFETEGLSLDTFVSKNKIVSTILNKIPVPLPTKAYTDNVTQMADILILQNHPELALRRYESDYWQDTYIKARTSQFEPLVSGFMEFAKTHIMEFAKQNEISPEIAQNYLIKMGIISSK